MTGRLMKHRLMTRHQQSGFSLLEAIVAMVLISGAGMALFSWINSSMIALARVQDANAISLATQNVMEFMDTVNPMLKPRGDTVLGNVDVNWKSTQKSELRDGVIFPMGTGLYQFAMYDTAIEISQVKGTIWFKLLLPQVGYKQVRTLESTL
ncbi:MAG: general secretion pathway protein I [Candidatus Paceibacteria bacterium]|jgi:general secretion pathway protein I